MKVLIASSFGIISDGCTPMEDLFLRNCTCFILIECHFPYLWRLTFSRGMLLLIISGMQIMKS